MRHQGHFVFLRLECDGGERRRRRNGERDLYVVVGRRGSGDEEKPWREESELEKDRESVRETRKGRRQGSLRYEKRALNPSMKSCPPSVVDGCSSPVPPLTLPNHTPRMTRAGEAEEREMKEIQNPKKRCWCAACDFFHVVKLFIQRFAQHQPLVQLLVSYRAILLLRRTLTKECARMNAILRNTFSD